MNAGSFFKRNFMPNRFDQPSLFTITSAAIPSAEDPSKLLRDDRGNLPSTIHEDGQRTWEETFQKMGRDILGRYVDVSRRATDMESGTGHLVYQSRPVFAQLPDDSPYQWR